MTEPSHRVDRVQEDNAWPRSPATELTEFRGAAKRSTKEGKAWSVAWPRGGQEEDKAQPQSSGARPVSVASSFLFEIEPNSKQFGEKLLSCLKDLRLGLHSRLRLYGGYPTASSSATALRQCGSKSEMDQILLKLVVVRVQYRKRSNPRHKCAIYCNI